MSRVCCALSRTHYTTFKLRLFSTYAKSILELVEINPDKIEWRLYEDWTPHHSKSRKNRLQSLKKDQSRSG